MIFQPALLEHQPKGADVRGICASAARSLALLVGLLLLVAGAVEAQTTVPGAPTIDTVTAGSGTTLVVTWTAPSNDGGSTITAYDVRSIETAATDKADANWTEVDDAWTSGSLTYTIAGLPENTQYDVQVRAVNAAGDGAWSATATGTTQDHGDTTATATSLTLDADMAGAIASGTDVDYFTFTLTQKTDLLVWTTGALDTVGALQDSSGTELASNDDNPYAADDPLASAPLNFFLWKTLDAGTYYIKVTSYGGATGSYVLRTRAPVDSSGTADAHALTLESDGIAVERGVLDPGGGFSGDSDYFTLTLSATTDIIIHTTTGGISTPLVILLQSNGTTEIARSTRSSLWPGASFRRSALLRHSLNAGTYYIRIKSNLGNADDSGFYNLHVNTVTDPGDTTATATPLRFGRARGGSIASASDVDYFRLELSETTDISVRAGGQSTTREVLDKDGNAVTELTALEAGTYYLKVTASGTTTGDYTLLAFTEPSYYRFLTLCEGIATSASITDPLYGCQWHLNNAGQRKGGVSGEDMNVEEVWAANILGAGINVAVVDTGLDSDHEDLTDNVSTARNHDYTAGEGEDTTDIYNPDSNHGTAVAGVIAARDNGLGVRGVAPRAMVYGYNLLQRFTDANTADAMTRNLVETHVSNNSWGPSRDINGIASAPSTWETAIETGLTDGAGGKGIVYVFAAGNAGPARYANLVGYLNHYGVTTVCAVTDQGEHAAYSEQGPNLWVCAPSGSQSGLFRTHDDRHGITTTDNDDFYMDDFTGTSAATPIVSGVAALVRSANTALTWRDVKLILAASARKTDADDTGWEDGALKYGSDTERYHFSHQYGFGVVDAKAAVDLADGWTLLPTFVNQTVDSATSLNLSIPDCPAGECPDSTDSTPVNSTLTMGSDVEFIEFVEINVNLDHAEFRDLQIELVSPVGTVSALSVPHVVSGKGVLNPGPLMGSVRLGSAKHLGENPAGTWTLRLRDAVHKDTGTLNAWSLTVYGHQSVPGAPTLDALTPGGGSLAVAWTAPTDPGGSTITAYDVRYIETAADETDDANWTVVDDAWTTGGGDLTYTIAGLPENTQYDVQVRAVNAAGDGAWSATATGTTQDHGDTTATATSLTLDTDMAGATATETDVDYFTFTLTQKTHLFIWTTGDLDTVGALQDSSGTALTSNDDNPYAADDPLASAPSNFFLWQTLAAGTYYIKVTAYGGATGAYVLRTRAPVDSSGTANAHALTLESDGSSVERGIIGPDPDSDYFTLTLSATTEVVIHTTGILTFSRVILLESDGTTEIARSTRSSLWPGASFRRPALLRRQLDAGTYYIKVDRDVQGTREGQFYNLYVTPVTDPGDTTATATPLRFGRARGGSIASASDVDYFRLELSETTDISVRAGGQSTTREVLDEDGNAVTELTALEAGTYYLKVTQSGTTTGDYTLLVFTEPSYYRFLTLCQGLARPTSITDPLYGCQWHLNNTGQRKGGVSGEDMNVEEVWTAGILGAGINVAVVDNGLDSDHEDLTDNVMTARNHDYTAGKGEDTTDPYNPDSSHGTSVAGIIAARDNGLGVRGVAPRATVYGYNLTENRNDDNTADAMTRNLVETHVSSNSWSHDAGSGIASAANTWRMAIETGLTQGAGGKGIVYVSSAGNSATRFTKENRQYSNLDEMKNHYGVIAVCAVNDQGERSPYSERGSNLWVCAPSTDTALDPRQGITTTGNDDVYVDKFGGTSASTPIVSGVVALVRSVDTALTWRDVKLILAASARKNDADNTGWEDGALKYGSTTERYHFSHEYGFGVVDAKAAVDLADGWTLLPTFVNQAVASATSLNLSIPDCPAGECPDSTDSTAVSSTLTVGTAVEFIEFVEINVDLTHADFRDLQIELVSPAGTVSALAAPYIDITPAAFTGSVRLGSAKHLGENPAGTWTLRLRDAQQGKTGTLNAWSLTVYGHRSTPGAPTLDALTPGAGSLAVAWTAPTNSGASAITAYEVRYIKTAASATDKADDSNWTEVDTGWTADATLAYTLSGLDTVGWDVQVRAVNAQGDSAWSSTLAATPLSDAPSFGATSTTRNVAENTTAGTNIGAPVAATDPNDTALTYTLSGTDAGSFAINSSTGQLSVGDGTTLNFEDTTTYAVTVRATDPVTTDDPTADSASIDVTINVTDVNEAPTLTGSTSIPSYAENGTAAVATYTATDPENATITWSDAGDDAGDFTITGGVLRFSTAPNFESPADKNTDNVYKVTVQAFDGTHTVELPVTVTVTNVDEAGSLTLPPQPLVNVAFTATLSDPDGLANLAPTWQWARSTDNKMTWTDISGATTATYTPNAEDDKDHYLRVTVSYTDIHGSKTLSAISTQVQKKDTNEPPVFAGTTTARSVAENTAAGQAIGAPVTATDPDDRLSDLRYSLSGQDATAFTIDAASGQLQVGTGTVLDYETKQTYTVTVTVTDPANATDTISVTISVTDVNEAPTFPAPTATRSVVEGTPVGSALGARFTATDDDKDPLTYSLDTAGAAVFAIDEQTGQVRTKAELDYETTDNYRVTVSVSDGKNAAGDPDPATDATLDLSVNVTDAPGTVTLSATRPLVGRALTASVDDPDSPISVPTWHWERSEDGTTWELLVGATTETYTPSANDLGHALRVTASYTDTDGTAKEVTSAQTERVARPSTGGGGGVGGGVGSQDDHGNSVRSATPIPPSGRTDGQFHTTRDVDYFTLTAPYAGVLVVETTGRTATQGTVWQGATEVATADSGGAGQNFRLSVRVAAGEPVVLAVRGNGRQTGPYVLQTALVLGYLENPGPDSFQSGIGVISGWVCEADAVEIVLETEQGAVHRLEAAYGTERADTAALPDGTELCGDMDNGFGLLFNWNLLEDGEHEVIALVNGVAVGRSTVDGIELGRATVTVTTLGAGFLRGAEGACVVDAFPTAGETVPLAWQQNQQNFVIAGEAAPQGESRAGTPGVGYLEVPGGNSFQSGLGVISGWVCEAETVEIVFETEQGGVHRLEAAYGTERADTATLPDGTALCGDTDNGFGLLFNWNLLGDGVHEVVAEVDGAELGRAVVQVTLVEEDEPFVRGLTGECVVEDFPGPGETVTLEWQQSQQNFVITGVD